MARILRLSLVAVLVAVAAGCGGSSSASLNSDDVAVVGSTHITKDQLNHRIQQILKYDVVSNQKPPKAGTQAYQSEVIDQAVSQLVQIAEVKLIADQLGVNVSDDQVNAQITKGIKQGYGGSKAKFEEQIKKYGYTDADVFATVQESLYEKAITSKLAAESPVNAAAAQAYYNKNKDLYTNTDDTREVDYILVNGKSTAESDLQKLKAGTPQATVAQGAIDSNTAHQPVEPFKATSTPGSIEKNFQKAAFSLPEGQWGGPVLVSKAYAKSSLAGKCTPDCYFLIRPTGPEQKKGTVQPFSAVKSQIIAQLKQTTQQQHVQQRVTDLLNALKKKTKYAKGYAPPAASTTPATTSSNPTS